MIKRSDRDLNLLTTDITLSLSNTDHIFEYEGWDLRWSGWRQAHNQFIDLGFWIAYHWKLKRYLYSTTLGNRGTLTDDLAIIDFTITEEFRRSYPNLFILTRIDKSKIAADAAWRLIDLIDQSAS